MPASAGTPVHDSTGLEHGAQRSYLHTPAQEAGREVPEEVTKAQASDPIDQLRQQTGRGD
ncbi:MAG: DUF3072 domain-containing protein [Mycobacterium sp.]|nr:DUF3072 domain-containing protein [Mycobacterium sp.]